MGKSRRGNREFNKEQKLAHENKRLKIELARVRKQLARLDLDRYENVKEMIEEHYVDNAQEGQDILENLKKAWACKQCQSGYLEIFTYNKLDQTWYFRRCSNAPTCKHRTESKRYTPDVKGIKMRESAQ